MRSREKPRKPIVVIGLGPGAGERLEKIGRLGNASARRLEAIGYDPGGDRFAGGGMREPLTQSIIHKKDMLLGLMGHKNNSVDAILSDFTLGYYAESGPRISDIRNFPISPWNISGGLRKSPTRN